VAYEKLDEHEKSNEVKELLVQLQGGIDYDALGI
jgi:hypothetical protein